MHSAAACASCTVSDVFSGFNGRQSMGKCECNVGLCYWVAVDDRGRGWSFGISINVMYSAAVCATCTVTDVLSGFNGIQFMARCKCYTHAMGGVGFCVGQMIGDMDGLFDGLLAFPSVCDALHRSVLLVPQCTGTVICRLSVCLVSDLGNYVM